MDIEAKMAKDSDDSKPTIEDVDRLILDHERRSATGQGMKKGTEERSVKDQEATKNVHFKKGESLWDRAAREVDAAEKGPTKG